MTFKPFLRLVDCAFALILLASIVAYVCLNVYVVYETAKIYEWTK
jgi:hypothetical protein